MTIEPRRIRILGQPVHVVDLAGAVQYVTARIEAGETQFIVAQNPEKIIRSADDEELAGAIGGAATLTVADGIGVVLAAKWMGLGRIPRVPGIDLFQGLLGLASSRGLRVFFYGATAETCRRLPVVIQQKYPDLVLAGVQNGWEKDEASMVAWIREAKPDLLFVALGSPRQEKWIAKHLPQLPALCAMGIGGSLDVLAGTLQRAPRLMRRWGLEWLFRLLQQPSRAPRVVALQRFAWRVVRDHRS